jgi:predicted nucleic acid-binding protein
VGGHPAFFVDGQTAAIALANDLDLVTRNFRAVPGFVIENWFGNPTPS